MGGLFCVLGFMIVGWGAALYMDSIYVYMAFRSGYVMNYTLSRLNGISYFFILEMVCSAAL
jgi:hypothetical protein